MAASQNVTFLSVLPLQVRAARALLDWTRDQLAETSGVPLRTVVRFEQGEGSPQRRTVTALRTTLEAVGVEFLDGGAPGVRLRENAP